MPNLICDVQSIHALWDELADFDAARVDEARNHLLSRLCRLVGADNAVWIGGVRMGQVDAADPMHGWRLRLSRQLHPAPALDEASRRVQREIERGELDATTVANMAHAGTFRANRLCDLVPPEWFEGDFYRWYYLGNDRRDCVWVIVPINADVEIGHGFFRSERRPMFSAAERDTLGYALRGLRWFHRMQMLGHGLGVGDAPLTDGERRVLACMLGGMSDKQIAAELGQSPYTTQEYAGRLYRKFGVPNRAALLALWLGRPIETA